MESKRLLKVIHDVTQILPGELPGGQDTPKEPIAPEHSVTKDGHRERMMDVLCEDDLQSAEINLILLRDGLQMSV